MDSKTDVNGTPVVRLHCEQCGCDVLPVDGVTAIWSRGYWWCAKHCRFFYKDGIPVVDLPSDGQLLPSMGRTEEP